MGLKKYNQVQTEEMSMIELAKVILSEEKKAINFQDIYDQISTIKNYTKEQRDHYIAQFYTDLNINGQFMTVGSNLWGLKRWYPVEQFEEEITAAPKKKKKKKAAAKRKKKEPVYEESLDEDLELEDDILDVDDDFDDLDEIDDDFETDDDTSKEEEYGDDDDDIDDSADENDDVDDDDDEE
ncbi:DNA-directed RNA polymerase subunit delta [Aquibacillus sp. 3ASR75-11]|uniref:Probable DNA-directed RNA polymerase subunit delta n=1 Tax=Terrihalobacillus insolitus TaxID=2950438 RepID=A0A9X3WST0_9BACI|nr:DNA-directed RNA polymerase subunit delta [Terrihalobacillus insolitus]MDC3425060.1 DNA-directed RNA polymerase subunit delta [Terrihalobacillus insolitus]